MAPIYTLDTTPSTPVGGVSLKDLGIRQNITHPTLGYNLTNLGITPGDVYASTDLQFAIDNNYAILYLNGISISTVTSIDAVEVPRLSEIYEKTKEPTGFVNRADSVISFTDGTRTFQIAPAITDFEYFIHGTKYIISSAKTVVLPNTTGLYLIYLDSNETLQYQVGFDETLLKDYAFVATVYWNATTAKGEFITEERHGSTMDWATHLHQHRAFGTRYYSGFGISFTTLTGDGSANNECEIAMSGGIIADEDIITTIVDDATPSNPFEQILSSIAQIPVAYKLGAGSGEWRKAAVTNYPILTSGGFAQYNSNSGSWAVSPVTDSYFVAMWIFAVPDINTPVIAIMGTREDATLDDAKLNNAYSSVSFGDLPSNEHKVLYRLIFECNSSYTNTPKASLREILDIRSSADATLTSNVTSPVTSHPQLLNLDSDDHLHYHTDSRGDARYYTKTQADANYQPKDATLTALAAYNTNGLVAQTAPDTFAGREIVPGSNKVQVGNGNGVSGNPSIDINEANLTLNNIGGTLSVSKGGSGATTLTGVLIGNGTSAFTTKTNPSGDFVGDTDTQTLTNKSISGSSNTLSNIPQSAITNLSTDLSNKQPLDSTLTSLAAYNTNGFIAQTAADTFVGRAITAASTKVSITNGNGVSGNPSVDINEADLTLNNIGGTLAINKGGTGQATALAGFNALSPLTTKGDLLSRDGTNNIRVPVGANNRYLVADSAQTSGLDWKALDVDSQTIVGGAPLSVLNLTNSHPNSAGLTYYDLAFTGADYTITTAGRISKNYIVNFSGTYGISSSADRYTYFQFLVNGVAQPLYDVVSFSTNTYRPILVCQTFTLNNIAPGTIIRIVYGIATNLGTSSPGSTTIRNYGMTFSIYGVG